MEEKIIYFKVSELKNNPNNPRKNDNAVDSVAKSIEKYGFRNPLIIDKQNIVWCGNTRLKAARKLNLVKVPCIIVEDLDEQQMTELALIDNKTNEIAEWDYDVLKDILKNCELDDFIDIDWGVEIENEKEKEVEEDGYIEPVNLPTKTHLGEIWQLGNHRCMCGDSTKEEDVIKLMDGYIADMVITDPPYNVNIGQGGGSICSMRIQHYRTDGATIKNDNMKDDEFYNFLLKFYKNMKNALKEGGSFYIWHADTQGLKFRKALNDVNLEVRQTLIWNKNRLVMGRQDYQWKHEPCLYGWKNGAGHYFIDDRKQTTVIEDKKQDFKKMKKEELIKLLEEIYSDKESSTIINENRPNVSEEHPTMKPIKLFARLIKNSSRQNEKILDLFGGSGTTLIACEQLNRQCYMMEFDPHYADVIIDRWEKFTGQKAKKIN